MSEKRTVDVGCGWSVLICMFLLGVSLAWSVTNKHLGRIADAMDRLVPKDQPLNVEVNLKHAEPAKEAK